MGEVHDGTSDEAGQDFRKEVLPKVARLVTQNPNEHGQLSRYGTALDPTKLQLRNDADVRVYFIGERSDNASTLGFTTDGSGTTSSSTAKLIFPNASAAVPGLLANAEVQRSAAEPLLPGDFVNLGLVRGGMTLDFFLIANGANGGTTTFSTKTSANPDGISHVVDFAYAVKNSPYLILGFEDTLGGGDSSFNDLLFAIDLGSVNVAALTLASEPRAIMVGATLLGIGGWLSRRRPIA